jgi:uncharacterized protein
MNVFNPAVSIETLIKIEARKFDRSVHRTWNCRLVRENDEMWIFEGVFEEEIKHPLLGVIRPGTFSLEYYWKNRWFNVFRFHEPEGRLRNFYCNLNMPPQFTNGILSYVDLDVDVLVQPDLSYQTVDLDEFAENALKHKYPPEIIIKVQTSLAELINLIETRQFPFDYQDN